MLRQACPYHPEKAANDMKESSKACGTRIQGFRSLLWYSGFGERFWLRTLFSTGLRPVFAFFSLGALVPNAEIHGLGFGVEGSEFLFFCSLSLRLQVRAGCVNASDILLCIQKPMRMYT